MNWLDIAKKLPTGHTSRYRHCGSDAAAVIFNDPDSYSMYCHRCSEQVEYQSKGYQNYAELLEIRERNEEAKLVLQNAHVKLPTDFTLEIPPEGMLWLLKASITPYMAKQAGFGWTPYFKRVVLPVTDEGKLVYYQARAVLQGQDPKYLNPKVDRTRLLYWRRHPQGSGRVVVTEDILSAERVFLAQKQHPVADTVSILGTKITIQQANQLAKYDRVTMWLDPDKAGRQGDIKIRRLLNLVTHADYINLTKDPKLLTDKQIMEQLCTT